MVLSVNVQKLLSWGLSILIHVFLLSISVSRICCHGGWASLSMVLSVSVQKLLWMLNILIHVFLLSVSVSRNCHGDWASSFMVLSISVQKLLSWWRDRSLAADVTINVSFPSIFGFLLFFPSFLFFASLLPLSPFSSPLLSLPLPFSSLI